MVMTVTSILSTAITEIARWSPDDVADVEVTRPEHALRRAIRTFRVTVRHWRAEVRLSHAGVGAPPRCLPDGRAWPAGQARCTGL
jgi:hypothetical protein